MTARKARGNVTCSYNSNNITTYCDGVDLDMAVNQLETTNLASTGAESTAGDTKYSIKISGMWDSALDAILGPDAITPGTKRTAVITLTGYSATVTYTWTSNAEIEGYTVSSKTKNFITFNATLALSGAPNRASA